MKFKAYNVRFRVQGLRFRVEGSGVGVPLSPSSVCVVRKVPLEARAIWNTRPLNETPAKKET